MDDYIKREAAIEICEAECQARLRMCDYSGYTVAWSVGSEIKALPAADVAPVAQGRWKVGSPICPVCGEDKFRDLDADIWCDWLPPYCPNCGARMDGGFDNG